MYAFTIVEMLVVIGIIALVLVIGVPAFSNMALQQRLSKTRQLINGTLQRTQIVSVSDQTLTAVRFSPAQWHLSEDETAKYSSARQIMTCFSWTSTSAANPDDPAQVLFAERFELLEDAPVHLLPPGVWVAPSEALDNTRRPPSPRDWDTIGNQVLDGTIGHFEFNADLYTNSGEEVLDADDFLIVFDPETGVRSSLRREPWQLLALDATEDGDRRERDGDWRNGTMIRGTDFQRFNFTGTIVYQREPFELLGADASAGDRRDALTRYGQTYYVDRVGGNLVAGGDESVED